MPEVEIDPEETALLLIAMQNDALHEKGKFCRIVNWSLEVCKGSRNYLEYQGDGRDRKGK